MHIQESGEMYLETVLILKNRLGRVRAVDIANQTGYSKPSVSHALGLLRGGGYLEVDEEGCITLTEAGNELASRIYERHTFLTRWLSDIGVPPEIAADDACKMEHDISPESFEAIKNFVKNK